MRVNSDSHAEYKCPHDLIWKDLVETLKKNGVSNYSIYLNKNRDVLFGYAEIVSEAQWDRIATTAICRKWWHYMKDIMPINSDGNPVSESLQEVFHLEWNLGLDS
ncbi:MAG: L-rhamnose mutarotase [Verrucomicrobia bacterium Tous-C9LFEB]|nr:MAG: L-rhamnose mutarotase [Verrucomicrobia bacterium Tous-C9LFEB]